jgi:hypothetical protein
MSDSCPVTCSATQKYCYVNVYDSNGLLTNQNQLCVDEGTDCPCAANYEHQCTITGQVDWWTGETMPDYKECRPITDACPCTGSQMHCTAANFDSNGWRTWMNEATSCVNNASECACGTNAATQACEISMDFYGTAAGSTPNWLECVPAGQSCPLNCASDQMKC